MKKYLLMLVCILSVLLIGCGGDKEETKVMSVNPGYEMLETEGEMFLIVVASGEGDVTVTAKKVGDDSEKITLPCVEGETVFGTFVEEEGYYEVSASCGENVQKKVIHMKENPVYSMWFEWN